MNTKLIKYYTIALCCLALAGHASLSAQDTTIQERSRSVLKVNPLQILLGEVRVLYEFGVFNHRNSLEVGGSFIHPYNIGTIIPSFPPYPPERYGGKTQLGYYRYWSLSDHKNFFITVSSFYKFFIARGDADCYDGGTFPCSFGAKFNFTSRYHIIATRLLVGWQWAEDKKIIKNFYFGLGGRYKHQFKYNIFPETA